MSEHQQIKVIGTNGQVSLGKEFAGKTVLIDKINEGIWVIKVGRFVPDSEQWLQQGDHLSRLDRALEWAAKNKPQDNFAKFTKALDDE